MDDKVIEGWLTDTKVFKELALKVVGRVIDGYVNPAVLTPKFQNYWAQAALAAGDTGVLAAVWLEISTVLTPELVAKLIYAIVQAILKNV